MNLGSDVIIITRDEARKLLDALGVRPGGDYHERLTPDVMEIVEDLRRAVKDAESGRDDE